MNPAVHNLTVGYAAVVHHLYAARQSLVAALNSSGSGGARDFGICDCIQKLMDEVEAVTEVTMASGIEMIEAEKRNSFKS